MESAAKDEPLEGAAWEGAMILKTQRHQSRADGSDTSGFITRSFYRNNLILQSHSYLKSEANRTLNDLNQQSLALH